MADAMARRLVPAVAIARPDEPGVAGGARQLRIPAALAHRHALGETRDQRGHGLREQLAIALRAFEPRADAPEHVGRQLNRPLDVALGAQR